MFVIWLVFRTGLSGKGMQLNVSMKDDSKTNCKFVIK